MPTLATGRPFRSAVPTLLVENALPPGRFRFQLVVIDAAGLASDPALLTVEVRRGPIGPVNPTRPDIVTGGRVTPTPVPSPRPDPVRPRPRPAGPPRGPER
jgi:hypothetical protein